MGVGSGVPFMGYDSLIAIAEESAFGTFVTGTANIEFNTESLKLTRESMVLESINGTRDFTKRLQGNDTIEGSIESDLNVASDGIVYLIKNAMGGTVTSSTITSGSYLHTLYAGDQKTNPSTSTAARPSLSVAIRRGDTHVFNHYGVKVNTLTFSGEVGSQVMMTSEIVGKGMSVSSTIPSLGLSAVLPCNFVGVAIQTGDSITNLGAECFTSFELSINNNINTDQRCLGSREVAQLPATKREITLTLNQRFDTLTAYNRFLENTMTAISIICDSEQTITAGGTTYAMYIRLPECYVNSNQPEVGDNDVLTHELEVTPMYNTEKGYSIQLDIRNATTTY